VDLSPPTRVLTVNRHASTAILLTPGRGAATGMI
jgi:hypothetical protein